MSSLMKIGELTKQTGLSIRTLHYYDEIGLLSPSHRTEVGHRLYSDQDIIRLQQILSLRQLGFSLKEIIECLETPEFALPKVIDLHRTRVQEQMALSRTLLGRLNAIATELETTQSIAVEQLIQAMETITMSEQYFTPEQQAVLEARFQQEETQWQELLNQAQAEMSKGTELNSHSAYKLARRWQLIMKSLIRGDEQLYESLVRMYQKEGVEAASWIQMDAATFEYILKALAFLTIADDMGLVISDKCFTADAKQVICLGDEAVRQLNLYVLGTEAILLGLLVEGKSVAAQVLTAAGVTFAAVQEQIVKLLGRRPTLPEGAYIPAQLPYAPRVKRVLELALEKASQLGQSCMTPEHILLGILKEAEETGGGVATHVLKEGFGIDLVHLEQQLRSAMSQ